MPADATRDNSSVMTNSITPLDQTRPSFDVSISPDEIRRLNSSIVNKLSFTLKENKDAWALFDSLMRQA